MFTLEGKIEIEMVDFWTWAQTFTPKDVYVFGPPIFNKDQVILKTTVNNNSFSIEMHEFWAFVDSFSPCDHRISQRVYGVPVVNEESGNLEIDFAASNCTEISMWSPLPKAATQWQNL